MNFLALWLPVGLANGTTSSVLVVEYKDKISIKPDPSLLGCKLMMVETFS